MSTYLNPSPVFGPVHSRRLGVSLGVNLMPAMGKICSFDCIYCENGLNEEHRTKDPYVTLPELTQALEGALSQMGEGGETPDVITFAGNGEPTTSPIFPEAIATARQLRDRYCPSARVAVLSNGAYADRPRVREALMSVEDNILKLDTVDADYIRLLDRPAGDYDVKRQVETFASYGGHVIIQTIFLTGTVWGHDMDDTGEHYVGPWLHALERIRPSGVTVYTIARDTPEPGLHKASPEALDAIGARVHALGIPCSVSY